MKLLHLLPGTPGLRQHMESPALVFRGFRGGDWLWPALYLQPTNFHEKCSPNPYLHGDRSAWKYIEISLKKYFSELLSSNSSFRNSIAFLPQVVRKKNGWYLYHTKGKCEEKEDESSCSNWEDILSLYKQRYLIYGTYYNRRQCRKLPPKYIWREYLNKQ